MYRKLLNSLTTFSRAYSASAGPTMPACNFTPGNYNSPLSYGETNRIRKENLSPALATYYRQPLLLHQGHMQWLWNHEGRRYLDLFGGIVTVSVGHCHPKVNMAAKSQMDRLWHTTQIYLHPTIHEYAEKLTTKMPGNLKVVYFVNSGSEANDLALLMSRLYTGRWEILSLRNAYHGASPYQMGITALSTWRYGTPSGFGGVHVVNPDPYQGPWGGAQCRDCSVQTTRQCSCAAGVCQAEDSYIGQLKDTLAHSCPKSGVAAFIAESIQGVGGTVQFPRNYLKKAFEMVRAAGGLCISDEVQTGFGRTGTHFWGFQAHDVQPDIVTMAKGIGNGYPLAAVVTTPEVSAVLSKALHFNTYGGNPVACAVGSSVLDVIEEDQLQKNSHELGKQFLGRLAELRTKYEIVGDVRGKGLMLGVEMVKNKETKEPLEPEKMMQLWERMRDLGVLIGKGGLHGNVFRIKPPMCITEQDVDFSVDVMDMAFKEFSN